MSGGIFGHVVELYEYRSMIANLVKRELRGRYKGSLLGFLWNFIIPLMQIVVYVMVFTIVFRQNIEDYYVYLIVGMVPWVLFSDSVSAGSGSIVENSYLITKIYFPRAVIPISIVLSKFVNYLISMAIVFLVIAVGGHGFNYVVLPTLILSTLLLLLFSIGIALILAAADVFMRDVQYMVTVILMLFIWLTPIMYVRDFIDNYWFQLMLDLNPMTYFVELFQDALYWGVAPTVQCIVVSSILALAATVVGMFVFEKVSPDFAEVI